MALRVMQGYRSLLLRARRLPPSRLLPKLWQKTRLHGENNYLRLKARIGTPGWPAAQTLRLFLTPEASRGWNRGLDVVFPFWNLAGGLKELRLIIEREFPDHRDAVIKRAEEHLAGYYRVLEIQSKNLKSAGGLPWHEDGPRGYHWDPRKTYLDTEYESLDGVDVKIPWELSRLHHWVTLAQAYCLTHDRRYLEEIITQWEDWRRSNPPGYGVNWANTMEVALRAANAAFAFALLSEDLRTAPSASSHLRRGLPAFMRAHGTHIRKNPESPTNHLVGDLTGLIFVSSLYPYFRSCRRWSSWAFEEMDRQLKRQVYADGMDFEGSTSYHRLVTEFFLASRQLKGNLDPPGPGSWDKKLASMVRAIRVYSKNKGRIVQIGDNDSGRLFHLNPSRQVLDHSYLPQWAALIFDDPSLLEDRTELAPEMLWLFGPRAWTLFRQWSRSPRSQPRVPKDQAGYLELPVAGIFAFRDPGLGHYLIISNGPNGQNDNGGHAHNDRLGFELTLHNEDIFMDPGTGVYLRDRATRDALRSTLSHNTLALGGQEQNRLNQGPFAMRHDVKHARKLAASFSTINGRFHFTGSHDGYARLSPGLTHRRSFDGCLRSPETLIITDETPGASNDIPVAWNYTLAPGVLIESKKGGTAILGLPSGRRYEFSAQVPWETREGLYSPEFGVLVPAKQLRCRALAEDGSKFKFTLKELKGGQSPSHG